MADDELATAEDIRAISARLLNEASARVAFDRTLGEQVNAIPVNAISRAEIDGEIASAITNATANVPGAEAGYAEYGAGLSTTAVYNTLYTVTPLTMTITGTGRPVDIEFYIPQFFHSVAGTKVYFVIYTQIVGSGVNVYEQVVTDKAPANNEGPAWYGKRRKVLTDGVQYYVALAIAGAAAGTVTFGANGGLNRMYGSVVPR